MKRSRPIRLLGCCYAEDNGELELYPHEFEDRVNGWLGFKMPEVSARTCMNLLFAGAVVKIRGHRFQLRHDTAWRVANQRRHTIPWKPEDPDP